MLILFLPTKVLADYSALSTQEMEVGHTTSNTHIIIANDWFVGLPSPEELSSNNSWTNRIRISQVTVSGVTIRSCVAPIWDVGPWNTTDNYWDPDSSRTIYGQLNKYWSPVGSNSAPATATPTGWDPSAFPVPPSIAPGSLDSGRPEADEAFFTSGFYNSFNLSTPLSITAYNYSCDEVGRHPWCIPCTYTDLSGKTHTSTNNSNQLNGAGIDLADGLFLYGMAFAADQEPRIYWNITQDLPSVSEVQILNQAGVTLYDRFYGQSQAVTNLPVPTGTPVSIVIKFNESMLETTQDDIQGIGDSGTAMPIVQYGSSPVTVQPAGGTGWSSNNFGDDTWTGTTIVPTTLSGPQTLSIRSFLTGQTNNLENELDADENTSTGYGQGPDLMTIFQLQGGTPTETPVITPTPSCSNGWCFAGNNPYPGQNADFALGYHGKVYIFSGNSLILSTSQGEPLDIWSSSDGAAWNVVTAVPNFFGPHPNSEEGTILDAYINGVFSYQDKMWVFVQKLNTAGLNWFEFWNSTDGANWTNTAYDIGGYPNNSFSDEALAINGFGPGAMIAGGFLSGSGADWIFPNGQFSGSNLVSAPWPQRQDALIYPFNNQMFIMGGASLNGNTTFTDIWSTSDGLSWSQVASTMPGASVLSAGQNLYSETPVTYNNTEWMITGAYVPSCDTCGVTNPTIWNSVDGANWNVTDSNAPDVGPLAATTSTLWLIGGDGIWYFTQPLSPTYTPTSTFTSTSTPTLTSTFTPTPSPTFTTTATPLVMAQATVGSNGAVDSLPNGTSVQIGPGVLPSGAIVSVNEFGASTASGLVSSELLNGNVYSFSAVGTSGPINSFGTNNVTLVLPFAPTQIPNGYSASQLQVAYFDGTNWNTVPGTLNTANNTLTVSVNQFSVYWGVLINEATPPPTLTNTPTSTITNTITNTATSTVTSTPTFLQTPCMAWSQSPVNNTDFVRSGLAIDGSGNIYELTDKRHMIVHTEKRQIIVHKLLTT